MGGKKKMLIKNFVSKSRSLESCKPLKSFSWSQSYQCYSAKVKVYSAEESTAVPNLNINAPSPIFGGSTGGLLKKAQVEEFYVISWNAKKEQIFEMPSGGSAIMRQGDNILKLSRKEQCLALTTQLRTKFKTSAFFYRVFPNGEVQYLHPFDGCYPEKVNKNRKGINQRMSRIGQNAQPIDVKFSGKGTMDI